MAKHYIITNREVITNPTREKNYLAVNDTEFIRTDGKEVATESLRFGHYRFTDIKDRGELAIYKESVDVIGGKRVETKRLPSQRVFNDLWTAATKKERQQGEILVFIHGYNSDLDNGLKTVRKLDKLYVQDPDSPIDKIVLFSWPAMSNLLEYRDDSRDAQASGYALGRALQKCLDFLARIQQDNDSCKQRIHLMSHSRGNLVVESMMAVLNDEGNMPNSLFSDALLMAPDVDYDAIEKPKPMYDLIDICERIHVFYHRKDKALGISETTKNAFRRLGKWGPKNSRLLPDDVHQYDVTHVRDDLERNVVDKLGNHWYYYSSSEVVEMVLEIFSDYKQD